MICKLLLAMIVIVPMAMAESFKNLGPQITSVTIQGACFTHSPQGKLLACGVVRAVPAKLIVVDAQTGELLNNFPLTDAHGGWTACTATDGSVYAGTDGLGHLYRYVPGENQIHDLGQILHQSWIWSVTAGDNGEIFAGTYPDGKVFRYHPKDGVKDLGTIVQGEQYIRSVAYSHGKVYAGVGSHAHLIELDLKTGAKRELLPKEYQANNFTYCVSAVGDWIVAVMEPGIGGKAALIFNRNSGKLVKTFPTVSAVCKAIDGPGGSALLYAGSDIVQLTKDLKIKTVASASDGRAMAIFKDDLVILGANQKLQSTNLSSQKQGEIAFEAPQEPTLLQSIETGPNGKIYVGGYLSGGAAVFDPQVGKSKQLGTIPQPEDIASLGREIYYGCYPQSRLYRYDTSKPWSRINPRLYRKLEDESQSRPVAMLGVAELNKVFTGTVPEYGHLGGLLAIYDPATDKTETFHDVVPNQSICSLAYSSGLIVGGTSIWGGLGQKPSEKEARLFIWDPKTNHKIFETVPLKGAEIVGGLFIGPDKSIWGSADSVLFIFDVNSRKVIFTKDLTKGRSAPSAWRGAAFVVHPNGNVYCALRGQLLKIDPKTKDISTIRANKTALLAMDRAGRLYFKEGVDLWQYTP